MPDGKKTGVVLVDHGSQRPESNALLEDLARAFAERFSDRYEIVEPAHMELAEPTIAQAFEACVKRGAERVVILPLFLAPGRHMTRDIPALAARAAAQYPGVEYRVAPPLGRDALILELLAKRAEEAYSDPGATKPSSSPSGVSRSEPN